MLTNMEAMIGCVEDVSVVKCSSFLKSLDYTLDKFINALKSPQPLSIEVIIVVDIGLILLGKLLNPASSAGLHGSRQHN